MYKVIYLYILRCNDGSFYTGVTNNLDKRIIEHNLGLKSDAYTFSRRPVELVYHTYFSDFNSAFEWEYGVVEGRGCGGDLIYNQSVLIQF